MCGACQWIYVIISLIWESDLTRVCCIIQKRIFGNFDQAQQIRSREVYDNIDKIVKSISFDMETEYGSNILIGIILCGKVAMTLK